MLARENLSRKEVKRFADRLSKRLERDGVSATFPQILEAVAAGLEVRDWNTLAASLAPDDARLEAAGQPNPVQDPSPPDAAASILHWRLGDDGSFAPDGARSPFASRSHEPQIDLVYGPPGMGKSALLNTASLDFCLARDPSGTPPRLAVVDVGLSSQGLFETLRDLLPPERKLEVMHRRLRMVPEHAINPLDTPLGYRVAPDHQRRALMNLIALISTSDYDPKRILPGVHDVAEMLVDLTYGRFSDLSPEGNPIPYERGVLPEVDRALASLKAAAPDTWWSCVDVLFSAREIALAELAQHQAVPTVPDLVATLRTRHILEEFGPRSSQDGEPLVEALARRMRASVESYPNLSRRTGLNLAGVRFLCLDIDGIAPRGASSPGRKHAAISYLLARHAATGLMMMHGSAAPDAAPADYAEHHAAMDRGPRRMVFEEAHRVTWLAPVRAQMVADAREFRWRCIKLSVASQLMSSFDGALVSMATGVWIAGVNSDRDAGEIKELFGLTDTVWATISGKLRGPGPDGAPFLLCRPPCNAKHCGRAGGDIDGKLTIFRLDPEVAWGFSTGIHDMAVRKQLSARVGGREARRILGRCFPGGTATKEIEARASVDSLHAESATEAKRTEQVIADLVEDLVEQDGSIPISRF